MSDEPRTVDVKLTTSECYYLGLLRQCRIPGQHNPREFNLVDMVAGSCGWNPLVASESMTVHYDGKEYVIRRVR